MIVLIVLLYPGSEKYSLVSGKRGDPKVPFWQERDERN